jgi:hypothetical protein
MKKTIKLTQRTVMNYIKSMIICGEHELYLTDINGVIKIDTVYGEIKVRGYDLVDMLRISCERHGADDNAQIFLHDDGTQEYFESNKN